MCYIEGSNKCEVKFVTRTLLEESSIGCIRGLEDTVSFLLRTGLKVVVIIIEF